MLNGFGSYRERTEINLSDVDFFVLTGPTGSGKSTIIDALCFALYGTVPRWGKGNVIKNALAPSATTCRVCLVFEASGARFAAVRQLTRDVRGQVHTKAARLDRLDGAVSPDAELDKLLEASVEQVSEGPDGVTAQVTELLGIGYDHFTQCVLLPQGRFAEFLHAKPGDRQDLLIKLLAFAVYEQVGQRARERGRLAASRLTIAEQRLAELGEITQEMIEAAARRVADLADLTLRVDIDVTDIVGLRSDLAHAVERVGEAGRHLPQLAALRMPDEVPALAARLSAADELVEQRTTERNRLDAIEAAAEQRCAGLTERSILLSWRDSYARKVGLSAELQARFRRRDEAAAKEQEFAAAAVDAEHAVTAAEEALTSAEQAHRAAALATELQPGQPCPVCLQPIGAVPHHDVPADLDNARATVKRAKAAQARLLTSLTAAGRDAAVARSAITESERQLAEIPTEGPLLAEVQAALAERDTADIEFTQARSAARTMRDQVDSAVRNRMSLQASEQQAWSVLRASRDGFVALQAPAVEGVNLSVAWQFLLDWAASQRSTLDAQTVELEKAEAALRTRFTNRAATLISLLAEHGVQVEDDEPSRAPVALAAHRERATRDLADLRTRHDQSTALTEQIRHHREESQIAEMLGGLLRSDGFERWLCAEALDSLVMEASKTLMQLSGGQYELDRSDRNELIVIDYNDAGTRRPVNTLSGGETFQASLALALALSRQVVGLSGGRRQHNAMFLDEGFGTLDESTLDTVASTLERLAEESDCMVGIVTHVPALAERVPVQFAVSRDGASSRVHRVQV
jgi:exonuclease SbcC